MGGRERREGGREKEAAKASQACEVLR